ncbi:MAG: hypothetical protein WDO69_24365 [Pseudomonadota bacterium]
MTFNQLDGNGMTYPNGVKVPAYGNIPYFATYVGPASDVIGV